MSSWFQYFISENILFLLFSGTCSQYKVLKVGGGSNLILQIHGSDSDFACSQVAENKGNYGHYCAAEDMCHISRKVTFGKELHSEDFKLQQQHPPQCVNQLVCCPFIFSY